MKRSFIKSLLLSLSLFFVACNSQDDLTQYVDPLIGSDFHGHVFVGASVPFGALQVGPQNIFKGWDWCSGYHYSDSIVIGFTHTHLSGTGCSDLGDILVMPFVGEMRTRRGDQDNIENSCASYYKHENEQTAPDYYSLLMDNGIRVELTATERVALHRYTFPKSEEKYVLINLKEGNGDRAVDTYMKQLDDQTIVGYRISRGWSPEHKVFFALKSDEPIKELHLYNDDTPAALDSLRGKEVKGVIVFDGQPDKAMMKVAISSVSTENALANLEKELPHWNFDKVRKEARAKWNRELSKIQIETPDASRKKVFYTAMYHTCIAPVQYFDLNGEFTGTNREVWKATDWTNYSTFSLWDTYRTLNPLFTIIHTDRVDDMVNSMLSIFDQQGKLPVWSLVGGETNCMPGYSAIPVIADAYLKGFTGFDADRALNACVMSATNRRQNAVSYVLDNGFIPCDEVGEATSVAMEYAVGDWGIGMMAAKMGKTDVADTFGQRGRYYRYYVDTVAQYVRPRNSDGSWLTPYNPFNSVHGGRGYFCEGTGWQYTFFVPQNPEDLISLLGGDETFTTKLDSLFTVRGDMGPEASNDISGLIGQYAHGNEPSHHVAYLYAYAGKPWKTAEKIRHIQDKFYTDKPDGIIGNEDCGQMSAWHVMSALGFYQVNPSNGVLVFGSPLFQQATIALPGDKTFVIDAENNSPENIYIQSVELNGQSYDKSYIRYEDVMKGGTLKFVMGDRPNERFGSEPGSRPKSVL